MHLFVQNIFSFQQPPIAKIIGPQGKILAVDMQAAMLNKIKEKAKKATLSNIQYLQATIEDETLKQKHFDRALLISVLGEIQKKKNVYKKYFILLNLMEY